VESSSTYSQVTAGDITVGVTGVVSGRERHFRSNT